MNSDVWLLISRVSCPAALSGKEGALDPTRLVVLHPFHGSPFVVVHVFLQCCIDLKNNVLTLEGAAGTESVPFLSESVRC